MTKHAQPDEPLTENWERQLRKGLLEFVVLLCLRQGAGHGYRLAADMQAHIGAKVAEGTIYPLLKKLETQGLVTAKWEMKASGPPRKCYVLTPAGELAAQAREASWRRISAGIERLASDAS